MLEQNFHVIIIYICDNKSLSPSISRQCLFLFGSFDLAISSVSRLCISGPLQLLLTYLGPSNMGVTKSLGRHSEQRLMGQNNFLMLIGVPELQENQANNGYQQGQDSLFESPSNVSLLQHELRVEFKMFQSYSQLELL